MCGIVACSGVGASQDVIVQGLGRMQYRGYDSYGFAYVSESGEIEINKSTETFEEELIALPESRVLLGHTRWATHGVVNLANSHPHLDPAGRFALVHNGIVDNFNALKTSLTAAGCQFTTTTDTEVILNLMAAALTKYGDRLMALRSVQNAIEGRNTLVLLFADGELLALRQGSPLVVGQGDKGVYLASDVLAFAQQTESSFSLQDEQVLSIKKQTVRLWDQKGQVEPAWTRSDQVVAQTDKAGFKHFMLKEILEQWQTIPQQLGIDEPTFNSFLKQLRTAGHVFVTGAGGAFYTAKQIAWLLRTVAGIKALDVAAYEIESMSSFAAKGDVLLAISQSGETADTLNAIQVARQWGLTIASLVNMPMSSMTRTSEFVFYSRVGPEECVLSTKSASAQITFGYLLANALVNQQDDARKHINRVSFCLSEELMQTEFGRYRRVASYLKDQSHLFVLGRQAHFANALITALNIKEASYLHAEAFSAGELKHGVIALIEPGVPVLLFMPKNDTYMRRVAAEVKTRGAYVIALSDMDSSDVAEDFAGNVDVCLPLPAEGSLLSAIIPGQLLAYYIAIAKGLNPDRPRNLAKSVTVQ